MEEFLKIHLSYYYNLENQFKRTTQYVTLDKRNENTFSNEYIKMYLSICSEIDVVMKKLCGSHGTKKSEIYDYLDELFKKYDYIFDLELRVKMNRDIKFKPLKDFKINEKGKRRYTTTIWWKQYNKIKHNRGEYSEYGNLKNVLHSLGALFILNMILLIEYSDDSISEFSAPGEISEIFEMYKWNDKMDYDSYIYITSEIKISIEKKI